MRVLKEENTQIRQENKEMKERIEQLNQKIETVLNAAMKQNQVQEKPRERVSSSFQQHREEEEEQESREEEQEEECNNDYRCCFGSHHKRSFRDNQLLFLHCCYLDIWHLDICEGSTQT